MEQPQQQQQSQQQQQQQNFVQQQISQNEKMNTSSYFCRQSTSRWTPTTEQIKLLKELYYINGVRSPSADQIQAICARLRRYGKIEGKNVFYWFQNHKARERQKKRLTPSNTTNTTSPQYLNNNNNNNTSNNIMINGSLNYWKQDENNLNNSYPCITNNNTGISCSSSSAGVVSGGGQLMGSLGYGAVNMENKFRDCSISGGGFVNGNVTNSNSSQWSGATNYNTYVPRTCYSNLYDHKYTTVDEEDQEQDLYGATHEIETLPLFPMHNEEHNNNNFNYNNDHHFPSTGFYTGGYRWSNGSGGNAASLELSLNSYGYSCYSNY